jgi:hypothetical protein
MARGNDTNSGSQEGIERNSPRAQTSTSTGTVLSDEDSEVYHGNIQGNEGGNYVGEVNWRALQERNAEEESV